MGAHKRGVPETGSESGHLLTPCLPEDDPRLNNSAKFLKTNGVPNGTCRFVPARDTRRDAAGSVIRLPGADTTPAAETRNEPKQTVSVRGNGALVHTKGEVIFGRASFWAHICTRPNRDHQSLGNPQVTPALELTDAGWAGDIELGHEIPDHVDSSEQQPLLP